MPALEPGNLLRRGLPPIPRVPRLTWCRGPAHDALPSMIRACPKKNKVRNISNAIHTGLENNLNQPPDRTSKRAIHPYLKKGGDAEHRVGAVSTQNTTHLAITTTRSVILPLTTNYNPSPIPHFP